jgi:hypothetical protein
MHTLQHSDPKTSRATEGRTIRQARMKRIPMKIAKVLGLVLLLAGRGRGLSPTNDQVALVFFNRQLCESKSRGMA